MKLRYRNPLLFCYSGLQRRRKMPGSRHTRLLRFSRQRRVRQFQHFPRRRRPCFLAYTTSDKLGRRNSVSSCSLQEHSQSGHPDVSTASTDWAGLCHNLVNLYEGRDLFVPDVRAVSAVVQAISGAAFQQAHFRAFLPGIIIQAGNKCYSVRNSTDQDC